MSNTTKNGIKYKAKRYADHPDPAKLIETLMSTREEAGVSLDNRQMHDLTLAVMEHNDGKVSADCGTVGVCWDADRLELPRVGIIPNAKLLSTKAGKRWRMLL